MNKNPKKTGKKDELIDLSPEEREFIDIFVNSELIYETVASQLNIPEDDDFYLNLVGFNQIL